MAKRSLVRTIRQPHVLLPNVVLPLFLFAVVSAGNRQATSIPGFPTHSYVTFVLAVTLVEGGASTVALTGNGLGTDIETGFLDRLALTPVTGPMLLAAELAAAAVLGLAQGTLYLLIGVAAGAGVETGLPGAIAILGFVLLVALAFGSFGLLVAARAGSAQQIQALVPLNVALLFMSPMLVPRNLISTGWFREITTYNPMSYLVEAQRSLLVQGWDGEALALGFGCAAGIALIALAAASLSLGGRLERT